MNRTTKTMRAFATYRVKKYDRESGELVGVAQQHNEITNDGIQRWIDILAGDSTAYLDRDNSRLRVYEMDGETPVLKFTANTSDASYPTLSTEDVGVALWRWSDISVDEYDADRVVFDDNRGSPIIFSQANPALGSKPSSQNWIYEYELTLEPSEEEENLFEGGLRYHLRLLIGDRTGNDYNLGEAILNIYELRGFEGAVSDSATLTADSISTSRIGTIGTITITFVAPRTGGETYFYWDRLEILNPTIRFNDPPLPDEHQLWLEDSALGLQEEGKTSRTVEFAYTIQHDVE
jgi:hypothetical protein